jgi:hypothetical protein
VIVYQNDYIFCRPQRNFRGADAVGQGFLDPIGTIGENEVGASRGTWGLKAERAGSRQGGFLNSLPARAARLFLHVTQFPCLDIHLFKQGRLSANLSGTLCKALPTLVPVVTSTSRPFHKQANIKHGWFVESKQTS